MQSGTVLVTGGAGFIGSNFVLQWISDEGTPLTILDKLTYAGNLSNLAKVSPDPRYRLVQGDIGDRKLVRTLLRSERPRAIVHFAAESHVDRSIEGPGRFHPHQRKWDLQPARRGSRVLVAAGRSIRGSASAFYTCPRMKYTVRSGQPIRLFRRRTPTHPTARIAPPRPASDHLVRAYHHTYGLPTLTTHCSNNYGPYQFPEKLIPLVILRAISGSRFRYTVMGRTCVTGCLSMIIARRSDWCWQKGQPGKPTTSAERPRSATSRSRPRSVPSWTN